MPPGATGSCESPLFVAYHWCRAVSLIVLTCQLEPWKRPNRVSPGDGARCEGPQIREDSYDG